MLNALTVFFIRMAAFGTRDAIQIILLLVVCGFVLWLVMTFVKLQPPFPQIIMFVVVLILAWFLLSKFGLL